MNDLTLCTSGAIIAIFALAATLTTASSGAATAPAAIAQMLVVTVESAAAERGALSDGRVSVAGGVSPASASAASEAHADPALRQWWRLDLPPPSAA